MAIGVDALALAREVLLQMAQIEASRTGHLEYVPSKQDNPNKISARRFDGWMENSEKCFKPTEFFCSTTSK